jgi:hypothetical protein
MEEEVVYEWYLLVLHWGYTGDFVGVTVVLQWRPCSATRATSR